MSAVRDVLRSAVAAVTFLTAVPIGRRTEIGAAELRGSLILFPAIGALIGALTAAVAWGAAIALPPFPAATLGVAAGALVTAAMHLDGLADTADGMGAALAGGDPSAAMHDPRLGVFGGAALALDLLLKVSVLSALVTGPRFPIEAIAASALGRAAAIALMTAFPYAGPESGTGGWIRGTALAPCLVGIAIGVGRRLPHGRTGVRRDGRRRRGRGGRHRTMVTPPPRRRDRRHARRDGRAHRDAGIDRCPRVPLKARAVVGRNRRGLKKAVVSTSPQLPDASARRVCVLSVSAS